VNIQSNVMDESFESQKRASAAVEPLRPLYWSIRRELWEHPSIYVAPLIVAVVVLTGFTISTFLGIWERALRLTPEQPVGPFDMAAGLMMLTGIVVSVFYCVDALHAERVDRSILFWKSLPVSDTTTVLAKASIPLVVLPLLIFAITVAMYSLMLALGTIAVMASGGNVATLWAKISIFRMSWLMLYHLITAHALWPAPVYCWLLLVSGWARRATILWAILPVLVVAGVEGIAFRTWHFASLVGGRLIGDAPAVHSMSSKTFPTNPMAHIAPLHFLGTPSLWIGLALAVVFLAAAVQLRRYQEPI
jgi:ABC-2 type transport system permease protein